jgi:hypothetical protein
MPGPSFRLSILDCKPFALTKSTRATPMFTLTDSASTLEISALIRAGPLETQTHQESPPRRINPLEYALTDNRAYKSFRIRTYIFIGLKAPWNEHLQKKGLGGACGFRRARQLGATRPSRRKQVLYCCRFGAEQFHREEVPCPDL